MFISDLSHFLDTNGNIAKEMNKTGRERASFIALIVDEATKTSLEEHGELRCMKKKCEGTLKIMILDDTMEIEYCCTHCNTNNGRISGWQGTKWDNRKFKI